MRRILSLSLLFASLAITSCTGSEDADGGAGGGTPGEASPAGGGEKPAGGETPNPAGGETPTPAGGETPKPAGGETPKPAGGDTPKPAGGEAPKPAGGETPKPAGGETASGGGTPAAAYDAKAVLMDPSKATEEAPDVYKARFKTTKGDFVVKVTRSAAPNGADRFYNLVRCGFYNDTKFFRVLNGQGPRRSTFVVQWGISGDPNVSRLWKTANVQDDPPTKTNAQGTITFAQSGAPHSRTTQVFVNLRNNARLDNYGQGFASFGDIVEGMTVFNALNGKYGEAPSGAQGSIQDRGNTFLDSRFPGLDSVISATIEP